MANTYTLISSVTVGSGGAANIEFTSIPQTYTDLLLRASLRATTADFEVWATLTLNGTTSGYTSRILYGDGSVVANLTETSSSAWNYAGIMTANTATASTFNSQDIYIPNYTGSNQKSVSIDFAYERNATKAVAGFFAGILTSTSAVTSILIKPNANNFVQHSTAYLYGISNA